MPPIRQSDNRLNVPDVEQFMNGSQGKILCVFGEHNYGDPSRGQGYEFSNFLPALAGIGLEVEFFESFNRQAYTNFAELNTALLKKVEACEPDLVFFVLTTYEIWIETLEEIRKTGARLVSWGTDDSWKYEQFSRFYAPHFDLWVTTSRDAFEKASAEGHRNFLLSQWAASTASLAEPLAAPDCQYLVSFVGSAYGNRPRWIEGLRRRGIVVECFGYGWPRGPISASELSRVFRESLISLNFGDSGWQFRGLMPYRSRQIKARVFEVPGAGGLLLTEPAEDLASYYTPGAEVEVFHGIKDLADKIHFLLNNPSLRDRMVLKANLRTRMEHTYEARFRKVFESMPSRSSSAPVDWESFNTVLSEHSVPEWAVLVKELLVTPFRIFLGKRRGPRAARRFLHEISWRLSGEATYRARGWPGRLFYLES